VIDEEMQPSQLITFIRCTGALLFAIDSTGREKESVIAFTASYLHWTPEQTTVMGRT